MKDCPMCNKKLTFAPAHIIDCKGAYCSATVKCECGFMFQASPRDFEPDRVPCRSGWDILNNKIAQANKKVIELFDIKVTQRVTQTETIYE